MINIAELLKNAPKDLKLYSPLCGHCKLSCILYDDGIRVIAHDVPFRFDKYGRFCSADDAECLLFPNKDYRTWQGWTPYVEPKFKVGNWITDKHQLSEVFNVSKVLDHTYEIIDKDGYDYHVPHYKVEEDFRLWAIRDAKNGDVLVTEDYIFIFKYIRYGGVHLYCHYDIDNEEFDADMPDAVIGNIHDKGAHFQPATKEQRGLLFQKIKESGYEWDAEKKELRKIKPHYDIANFQPFDKVLVRDNDRGKWRASIFSYHIKGRQTCYPFCCIGNSFSQCIPYEGNEHLFGTTDMCDERFINW